MQGDPYEKRPPYTSPPYAQGGFAPPNYPPPIPQANALDVVAGVLEIVIGSIGVLCGAFLGAVGGVFLANRPGRGSAMAEAVSAGALFIALGVVLVHVLMIVGGIGVIRFRKGGFIVCGVMSLIAALFIGRSFFFAGHFTGPSGATEAGRTGYMIGRMIVPTALFALHGFLSIYCFARVRAAN